MASPFIIWELWKFVAPGLYTQEKRLALLVTASTALCFLGGSVFGYVVLSKPALTYLFSFAETVAGARLPFKIEPTVMMERDGRLHAGHAAGLTGRRSSCRS